MSKEKYVFNEHTLQYEKHKTTSKQVLSRLAAFCTLLIVCSVGIYFIGSTYFPTPKETAMASEIEQLQYHLKTMESDFEKISGSLEDLHDKDNDVHRMIFGMKPIEDGVWNGGVGGTDRYKYLTTIGNSDELIENSSKRVDKLKRKIAMQTKSLDSLYNLAIKREKKLSSIPSIKPIVEAKLARKVRHLSGYGIRLHPVHKVRKLHQGIDFTAPKGTEIRATGDGVVKMVKVQKRGYGKRVMIDHGFGFETLYAHMQSISVKKGQKVKKGEIIGTVGNTGTSTAPHLHYEVRINGKAVNPIDYVLDGLTPEEYQEVVEKASIENQSWD